MKPKDGGAAGNSVRRTLSDDQLRGLQRDIRMEWMDPMSWRLPSGKALAEFALQSGFLAPLMLVGPRYKKPKKAAEVGRGAKQSEEAGEHSGSFREASFRREAGYRETGGAE